jgi:RNA polymerase sigma factor (sigma-70 family)
VIAHVTSDPDIEAWEAYRRGECPAERLASLLARHERSLMKLCVHLTRNSHDACDLFQQTVTRLLAGRPEITRNFPALLKRTACNLFLNERKRGHRLRYSPADEQTATEGEQTATEGEGTEIEYDPRPAAPGDAAPWVETPESDHDPTSAGQRHERGSLLLEALDQLDDRTRVCVVLRIAAAHALREIAALLGVSAPRCKQLTDKGLRILRQFSRNRGFGA